MAWRQVASFDDALDIVVAAGQPNGSVLIAALHLRRSGGCALDLCVAAPGTIRTVRLCDAGPIAPASMHARNVYASAQCLIGSMTEATRQ